MLDGPYADPSVSPLSLDQSIGFCKWQNNTNGQWSMVYCFIWLSQQAEAS